LEEPSDFLVENLDILPSGKALDIAMGSGRNAVYLALNGFEVEGVDISQEAVEAALELALRYKVKIKAIPGDLENNYCIKKYGYDVIICFNYLQRSLINNIKAGLKEGGMVVYETYIVDQAELGKPKNPDFLLQHNELISMFSDFRCLRYREGIFDSERGRKAIAGIIAQKNQREAK